MKRTNFTAFLSIASARLVIIAVSALMTPLLVRFLTREQYGTWAFLMAIFGMLMILVSSGINSGVRKYLAEEREDPHWEEHVFGVYFRLALLLAVVPAVGFAVAAYTGVLFGDGPLALDQEYAPFFYLLAVLTLAAQFREYVRRALMGLKLEHLSEPLRVLHKAAFGVLAVGLAFLGYGVWGVITGEIIASLLVFVVASATISRRISPLAIFSRPPAGFPRRELFNFNHLTVVYFFLLTSLYHVDVVMLNLFQGQAVTGTYKGALAIVQFIWVVPKSVQSVMIQSTSNLWAQGNVERINELASKITRYTLLFTGILTIGLAALAQDFVPLYLSQKHAAAVLPVLLLLPGTLGFAIARPIFAISHAKGALKVVIAATGAAAGLNLVLNAALIPAFGMAGAAVATTIGYGSLPLFHVLGAHRIGYEPFRDLRATRVAATGLIAAGPIFALSLVIDTTVLALLLVPPVGFAIYATAALLTGAITVVEILEVLAAMPDPIGGWAEERYQNLTAADPIRPFTDSRVRRLLTRGLLVIGVVLLAVGLALSIGTAGLPVPGTNDTSTNSTTTVPTPSVVGVVHPFETDVAGWSLPGGSEPTSPRAGSPTQQLTTRYGPGPLDTIARYE